MSSFSNDKTALTKGEQTQQALIQSAYKLFLQKGYHGTSMRQIAKGANLALGGIYNHFASKEEIFRAVVLAHHPFLKIFPKFEEATEDSSMSPKEMIRNLTHLIFSEFKKEPQLLNLMFIELVELEGDNLAALFPQVQPRIFIFLQKISAQQPNWRIPNPIIFLRSYIGFIIGFYITDRFMPKAFGPSDAAGDLDDYLEIFFHGLFKD
ncbi:MAG: TetR/AcrR family transcriptional regulator [Chloroflexota bacterium]